MTRSRFDRVLRPTRRALWFAGLAMVAATLLAACGGAGGATTASPLGAADHATRTVQLNLIISGSRFNGYVSGQMTVRVPKGWRVDVYCGNETSRPHSCAIVSGATSTSPAFAGAATPNPLVGVPAGRSADFSFIVTRAGSYRVTSLVSGYGDRNMWERFDVVTAGRPSVSTLRAPAGEAAAPEAQARRMG